MKYTVIILSLICFISCKNYRVKAMYKEKHDKYRTLWYRTDEKCFHDSCQKYGLLYDSICGNKPIDIYKVDTIPVDEPANCK